MRVLTELCTSGSTTSRYKTAHNGKNGQAFCKLWSGGGFDRSNFYNGPGWDCSAATNRGKRDGISPGDTCPC